MMLRHRRTMAPCWRRDYRDSLGGLRHVGGHSSVVSRNFQNATLAGRVNDWMASRINSGAFAGDGIVPGDGIVCGPSALGRMFVSCTVMDQNVGTIRTALVTVYDPANWAHSPVNVSFSQN